MLAQSSCRRHTRPRGSASRAGARSPRLVAVDRPCESKSKACCEEASADALWDGQTAVKMLRPTAETALVEFTLNDSTNDEDGKGGPIVHVAVFEEGFREFRLFRSFDGLRVFFSHEETLVVTDADGSEVTIVDIIVDG